MVIFTTHLFERMSNSTQDKRKATDSDSDEGPTVKRNKLTVPSPPLAPKCENKDCRKNSHVLLQIYCHGLDGHIVCSECLLQAFQDNTKLIPGNATVAPILSSYAPCPGCTSASEDLFSMNPLHIPFIVGLPDTWGPQGRVVPLSKRVRNTLSPQTQLVSRVQFIESFDDHKIYACDQCDKEGSLQSLSDHIFTCPGWNTSCPSCQTQISLNSKALFEHGGACLGPALQQVRGAFEMCMFLHLFCFCSLQMLFARLFIQI